jgi:ABC-2 type transport system permease protein
LPSTALLAAESRRVAILSVRYPAELALSAALMIGLFYGLAAAGSLLGARPGPDALAALAAAYLVWLFAAGPLVGIAADVQDEARGGTLENLCLARYPLAAILLARAGVSSVHALALLAAIGAAMAALGTRLQPSWALLAYAACVLAAAAGLGMALAGLALVWKRVQFLLIAVHVMLLPFVIAQPSSPATSADYWLDRLVPLATAVRCAKAELAGAGCAAGAHLAAAIANGAAWLALGLLAFGALRARAEAAGTLAER